MKKISLFKGEYGFLSNFHMHKVKYEDMWFPSTEHAYQASKTLDLSMRELIACIDLPNRAKKQGRRVQMRPDWDLVKFDIMESLVRQKFSDAKLKEKLLETGEAELIEGNWWGDTVWGVCDGVGDNRLGKILMKIRQEISNETSRSTKIETRGT